MFVYVISKLFTYLFLPPGSFVILLFIASVLVKRFKWIFLLGGFSLWALSTSVVKDALLFPLERINLTENVSPAAVVVLSGGSYKNDVIKTTPDAFKRLVYGYILSCKYNLPLVLSGGGIKTNDADNMLEDLKMIEKVSKCRPVVLKENGSLNTYQNGKFTYKLFERMRMPKRIYLITDAYHMKRAEMVFEHFGFKIVPKPVGFEIEDRYTLFDFLPQMKNLYYSYKAIHEYVGILSLKLAWIL
ncbi:YdcF family protein [Hippea alviniae]|uniref:YdcF family protein n=1 Tax=Hippea alviniae TaxID=1279027 RepID=UPI0003B38EDC|nr:YdcF family protein [Hippea alviniae]